MDENKNFENEENGAVSEGETEETVTEEAVTDEILPEDDAQVNEDNAEVSEGFDKSEYTAAPAAAKKSPVVMIVLIVLGVLIIAAAVLTTMVAKGIGSNNKFMQSIGNVLHINQYNKDYVDVTGKTVKELAESQNMTLEEFLTSYDLPADMPSTTSETAAYYTIPVKKMAEMYKMDFATLKEVLKFPDTVTEDTSWGEAEGLVKVGDYVGTENLDAFKQQYGLGEEITADTLWKDVRNTVDESQKKQRLESETASSSASGSAATSGDTAASGDTATSGDAATSGDTSSSSGAASDSKAQAK